MSRRAYSARPRTITLLLQVRRLPGVSRAEIVAPSRGTHPKPARIWVVMADGCRETWSLDVARRVVGEAIDNGRIKP